MPGGTHPTPAGPPEFPETAFVQPWKAVASLPKSQGAAQGATPAGAANRVLFRCQAHRLLGEGIADVAH